MAEPTSRQLYVFNFDGGEEYWIAYDKADALAQHNEQSGCGCDDGAHEIIPCRLDQLLKIWCLPSGDIAQPGEEGAAVVGRTCAEWLERQPRGMLCTRNY